MVTKQKIVITVLIVALGGFLSGINAVLLANTGFSTVKIPSISMYAFNSGIWVSVIGIIFAAALAVHTATILGRKIALILAAVLVIFSELLIKIVPDENAFLAARFICGTGMGLTIIISPLYLSEIVPENLRKHVLVFFQASLLSGVLATLLLFNKVSLLVATSFYAAYSTLLLSALYLILLTTIYNSPRWLLQKGHELKAKLVLLRLGYSNYEKEYEDIKKSIVLKHTSQKQSIVALYLKYPLTIALLMLFINLVSATK